MLSHGSNIKEHLRLRRPETADVLVRGHSHRITDEVVDGVRVVNPGALFRAKRYTVGVFDTRSRELDLVELEKE